MKKKNSYIELQRFICAILIFLYHTGVNNYSWIATEFFFILSGYFIYQTSLKEVSIESTFIKKFKSVLPYTSVAIIGTYIMNIFVYKLGFHDILRFSTRILGDLFLLNSTGFVPKSLQVSDAYIIDMMPCNWLWYVTSMLFCVPVIMYLYRKHRDKELWLTSIFALSLYGILVVLNGTINGFHSGIYTFILLNVRALAGLLLGGLVAILKDRLAKCSKLSNKSTILLIAEIGMFIVFIGLCFTEIPAQETLQIPFIVAMLTISFSGITATGKFSNKGIDFIGSLALPFYCYHTFIYTLISVINVNIGMNITVVRVASCLMTIVLSTISVLIVKSCTSR